MAKGAVYPHMSIPDIISSFEAWGMIFEEDRLLRPTPEFVEGVFCACLARVMGINPEDLTEPAQEVTYISSIDEKDIYVQALRHNLLLHHLSRFAIAARIEDFSAMDLAKPTKDRTLILLSAFINFVKFTEQLCEPFIKAVEDRSDALLVERDKVSNEYDKVKKQIDELKAKMAEDEPLCEELRAKNKDLVTKIVEQKRAQQTLIQTVEDLKAEKTNLLSHKETLRVELEAVSDTNRRMQGRIVRSPDRVKRSISTMSTSAVEYKKTITMNETKIRDLQAKINALMVIEQDLRSCVDQLQVIEKESTSLQELQNDLGELKDQLDDKIIERNELQLKHKRVLQQLENAHQRLGVAQQRAAEKKESSERKLEALQKEYDEMDVERKKNDVQLTEVRKEADSIEEKMAELLRVSEDELNGLLKEYWALRRATEVYMETLANSLNLRIES